MIDEKTIKEAAYNYIGGEDHDKDKLELFEFMRVSFINGADWAIYEFQQRLWHDASEKPEDGTSLLFLFRNSYGYEDYGILCNYTKYPWDRVCKEYNVVRWAYISDLIPKGGE